MDNIFLLLTPPSSWNLRNMFSSLQNNNTIVKIEKSPDGNDSITHPVLQACSRILVATMDWKYPTELPLPLLKVNGVRMQILSLIFLKVVRNITVIYGWNHAVIACAKEFSYILLGIKQINKALGISSHFPWNMNLAKYVSLQANKFTDLWNNESPKAMCVCVCA